MVKARDWVSRSAELRRLGRFLFPPPPEWGWAPPVQEQNLDTSGPGWSLAYSLMFVLSTVLMLGEPSGGWCIFVEVVLVVAVGQAVLAGNIRGPGGGRHLTSTGTTLTVQVPAQR